MSTNYYVQTDVIEPDGPDDPGVHLGKWSSGWGFLARAHPGVSDTAERWRSLLASGAVRTEADVPVAPQHLLELVRAGRREQRRHQLFGGQYEDDGMRFESRPFC